MKEDFNSSSESRLNLETHPNYAKYSRELQDGWIFGRKVDNSDMQFSEFRDNFPLLALALGLYLVLSHLFRILYSSKLPTKLATQPLRRAYFFLAFSTIFLYVLFGNSIIFIFIILSLNYAISRIFRGSRANPIITWIFNLFVLFLNEAFKGYHFKSIDERLAFLLRYPCEITLKEVLLYGVRLLLAILTMEFMLHYVYAVAISNTKAWENDTPFELGVIGIFNLLYVWLK
ncbi:11119_t:CDS:2, partial [Acaulospora colombiana]